MWTLGCFPGRGTSAAWRRPLLTVGACAASTLFYTLHTSYRWSRHRSWNWGWRSVAVAGAAVAPIMRRAAAACAWQWHFTFGWTMPVPPAIPPLPLSHPLSVNSFNVAAFRRTISSISFWLRLLYLLLLLSLSLSYSFSFSLSLVALLPFPSFSFAVSVCILFSCWLHLTCCSCF